MRTRSLHEAWVEAVGDEWLLELAQKVLEEAAHHVHLVRLLQQRWGPFAGDVLLPELLDHPLAPRDAIDPLLQSERREVMKEGTRSPF